MGEEEERRPVAPLLDIFSVCPLVGFADEKILRTETLDDTLVYLDQIPIGASVIDVGSGAGLPGLPIAYLRRDVTVTLLDSVAKKIRWAERAAADLGLSNVRTVVGRAEEAARDANLRGRFDAAVAKGVAPLGVLVEYALPFVRAGGLLLAPKGREARRETSEAARALEALGGRIVDVRPYRLAGVPHDRHLVVVEAVRPAPDRYPRAVGTPAKRPL